MKFNNISFTLLFFVMIMFIAPFTLAPWSTSNPPRKPEDDKPRTCTQWITYHGFTLDRYNENRMLSLERNFRLDEDASIWAAVYAFILSATTSPLVILPKEFCFEVGEENDLHPFKSIKNEIRTCEGWILLYGFSFVDAIGNVSYAKSLNFVKNYAISIWADNYCSYISSWKKQFALTPSQFCVKIGKSVAEDAVMPFMSRRVTKLTCEAWIKLYEFTDNIPFNYEKAQRMKEKKMKVHINYWPKQYANYLRRFDLSVITTKNVTPSSYCNSKVGDESTTFNFSYPLEELEDMLLGEDN